MKTPEQILQSCIEGTEHEPAHWEKVALKAIEAYHAQFEEGWVSVDERMPEKGQRCFVTAQMFGVGVIGHYIRSNEYGNIFHIDGHGGTYNVTHYIEINLPPLTT
jgi:hypothetical protein